MALMVLKVLALPLVQLVPMVLVDHSVQAILVHQTVLSLPGVLRGQMVLMGLWDQQGLWVLCLQVLHLGLMVLWVHLVLVGQYHLTTQHFKIKV